MSRYPGRPRKAPEALRTEVIRLRLNHEERAALEEFAGVESMSAAIRRLLAEQEAKKK